MVKVDKSWAAAYTMAVFWLVAITVTAHIRLASVGYNLPGIVHWLTLGASLLFLLLIILGILRHKISYIWWEALLILLIMGGVWILSLALFPVWLAVLFASIFTLMVFFLPFVWLNNLYLLYGATGLGLVVAWRFPWSAMLFMVIGVVVYEYYRYKVADLASLIADAWKVGIPPGLLLPHDFHDWWRNIDDIWRPGLARVVSALPFIIISALFFQQLAVSYLLPIPSAVVILLIGFYSSQVRNGTLRTWAFTLTAGLTYLFFGLIYRLL